MNKFKEQVLRNEQKKSLFIAFWMAGFPNYEESIKKVKLITEYCDILEIGFPCSDPIADGPILTNAARVAIQNGITTNKCFEVCNRVRQNKPNLPIVAIVYLNSILQYEVENFFEKASKNGINAIIIPEISIDNIEILQNNHKKFNIDIILMASSNTSKERFLQICKQSTGFIYAASSPSITGLKYEISSDTINMINNFKSYTDIPVFVGFGISSKSQIKELEEKTTVDGIIIASKLFEFQNNDDLRQFLDYINN